MRAPLAPDDDAASRYKFVNDVSGDNQIGTGTTNTTWNLQ